MALVSQLQISTYHLSKVIFPGLKVKFLAKMVSESPTEETMSQFDWLTLHKDMEKIAPTETFTQKFGRKFSENPFVPIGCLATTAALSYGLWTLKTGDRKMSQYMMRTRVVAQGLTILALVVGVVMGTDKLSGINKK